jgi:4-diphosphocytidyl-2-C-methyl-D-erythritol kinase
MKVERQSPCKINLLLNVVRKREDGFHELETLMHPVALFDDLEFMATAAGIQIDCNHPDLHSDESNLIFRAARSFLELAEIDSGVYIRHEKRIPLAGGLAGGSANAAHTLRGLNELFDHPLADGQLHEIAASHGSDINFFLQDSPALATGRGEAIESCAPLPALAGKGLLLINPGFGIPTPWTFRRLAGHPDAITGDADRGQGLIRHLRQPDLRSAPNLLFNSLEAPVFPKYPLLRLYRDFLTDKGAIVAMMSGSGSTTYAITDSPVSATELSERFVAHFGPGCWIHALPLATG